MKKTLVIRANALWIEKLMAAKPEIFATEIGAGINISVITGLSKVAWAWKKWGDSKWGLDWLGEKCFDALNYEINRVPVKDNDLGKGTWEMLIRYDAPVCWREAANGERYYYGEYPEGKEGWELLEEADFMEELGYLAEEYFTADSGCSMALYVNEELKASNLVASVLDTSGLGYGMQANGLSNWTIQMAARPRYFYARRLQVLESVRHITRDSRVYAYSGGYRNKGKRVGVKVETFDTAKKA